MTPWAVGGSQLLSAWAPRGDEEIHGLSGKRECDVRVSIHPVCTAGCSGRGMSLKGELLSNAPDVESEGGCVDARLEALLGIVDALFSPLVSKRASNVVDVPRGSAGGGAGEHGMEEHDGAAMDEEADLGAKGLVSALLEVFKEIIEHGAGELDIVV